MSTPPNTPPPSPDAVPWPPQQLARLLELLIAPDQVVELRALGVQHNGRPHTEGGFFDGAHLRELAFAAHKITRRAKGVYFTLNPLRADLQARRCNRIDWAKEGDLAKDSDVLRRNWLLIDVDPVRESGISASDEEKSHAWEVIQAVRQFLRDRQWSEPILCDSGNGYHLLYRIDLPADDGGLISKVLLALAHQFDTDRAKVDRSVFNAGRICKLPGTQARKGDSIPNRPHRWAQFLELENWPEGKTPSVTPAALLEQLVADDIPASPSVSRPSQNAAGEFASIPSVAPTDSPYTSRLLVDQWLRNSGIEFRVKSQPDNKGRTTYVLAQCPFDASHGDPDSCILQEASGKMAAHCFHNSCQGRGWHEFKNAIGAPQKHHYDPPLPSRRRKSSKKHRQGPSQLIQSQQTDDEADDREIEATCSAVADMPQQAGPQQDGPQQSVPQPEANNEVAKAAAPIEPTAGQSLPCIQGNKRQLRVITRDALNVVRASNNPPSVYQRGNSLTRIRFDALHGAPMLEPFNESALRGALARVANWILIRETQDNVYEEPAPPPLDVVKDMLNLPSWKGIPLLDAAVECPVFASDGTLIQTPGYHPNARLWLHLHDSLQIPEVAQQPSGEDVEYARCLLLDDLFADFPFADDASRATALAALLLPFVRPLIEGPTPLHLFDAPTEGTGKTLLSTVISLVATGRDPEVIPEAKDDDEWRKRLTAFLADGPTFILLDNLNRTLDSGALASLLTSRVGKDRLLGHTRTIVVPNRCVWLASGNNTKLSRELIRRTTFCRLDAKVDNPWERREFKHPKLIAWTRENRGKLIWACLTLCQSWLRAGRPPGSKQLGMFEDWATTISGILEHLGIGSLLDNANKFRDKAADQVNEWRAFTTTWWQTIGSRTVGVLELFELASREKLLDSVLGDKGEHSQRTRLGMALGRAVDRIFGPFHLQQQSDDKSGRHLFRLVPVQNADARTA